MENFGRETSSLTYADIANNFIMVQGGKKGKDYGIIGKCIGISVKPSGFLKQTTSGMVIVFPFILEFKNYSFCTMCRSASSKAAKILENIGGPDNIRSIDACITRLRLNVADEKAVKDAALKQLGASGVMRLGQGAVQIVFGPQSEQIKDEIKKLM